MKRILISHNNLCVPGHTWGGVDTAEMPTGEAMDTVEVMVTAHKRQDNYRRGDGYRRGLDIECFRQCLMAESSLHYRCWKFS